MSNITIEELYVRIHKHITLLQSYTEIKGLAYVIQACRLKPTSYVFDGKKKVGVYRCWYDEFGNTLNIVNKTPRIIYNNLSIDRNKIQNTDLYYGLSLSKIIKASKVAHLTIGKDDDWQDNFTILTLLGIDNHLRSYMLLQKEWAIISPLYIGIDSLLQIAQNQDLKFFKKLPNSVNNLLPCQDLQQWLTCIPTSKLFNSVINTQFEFLSFLQGNEIND